MKAEDDITQDSAEDNAEEIVHETMSQSIIRSVIGLSIFAIVTAGLIAITQVSTKDIILEQIKIARSKALFEIVPLSEHNNDMLADSFWLEATQSLGLGKKSEAFLAKQDGVPTTLILPVVAPEGYSGPIRLIVGIDTAGTIKGVRVIKHKETPGLGDKIDLKKSDWILDFEGKSLLNTTTEQWQVKKDGGEFDQLTGATITPRAIVKAVYQALVFYRDHKAALLSTKAEIAASHQSKALQQTGGQ
ncbi:MAG: electron transport complex protein RnfG [Oleiphilaceae bacterium]|jgi:electron transport complex protein RnfG